MYKHCFPGKQSESQEQQIDSRWQSLNNSNITLLPSTVSQPVSVLRLGQGGSGDGMQQTNRLRSFSQIACLGLVVQLKESCATSMFTKRQ